MIDPSPPQPARRLLSFPSRLTLPDIKAVLGQATAPDALYQIDGWILMAMAGELLANRAGCRVNGRQAGRDLPGQRVLFDGVEVEDEREDEHEVGPAPGEPVMGSGWPEPPGTPLVPPEVKPKRRKKARTKASTEAAR